MEIIFLLFYECYKLSDIKGLENWNVSKAKNFSHMFSGCWSLSDIKSLENWHNRNKNFDIKDIK